MQIRFIKNADLNKKKWDACISNAANGLIYGYSWYLDITSKHWDGMVLNDYEAVMPLTWNRKYGFYYLYQPFFCQSLGLFGNDLSAELLKTFFETIPSKFKFWDIYLNRGNLFKVPGYTLSLRSNYVLNLDKPFEKLAISFNRKHQASIKRAKKEGCLVKKYIPLTDVLALAKKQSEKYSPIKESDYQNLSKLYQYLHKKGNAITYGVYKKEELLASGVWLLSHNRIYYVLAGNRPEGRTSGASHFLISEVIREYSGMDILFDFEGSNVPGIATFFKRFGAVEEKYSAIRLNKLPPLIRLLK